MIKDDGKWSVLESLIGIQMILIMLKVIGFINLGWFWIFIPTYITFLVGITALIVIVIGVAKVAEYFKKLLKRNA